MQRGSQTKVAGKWHELKRLSEDMVLHWKKCGSKVQLQTDSDPRQKSERIRTRRSGYRHPPTQSKPEHSEELLGQSIYITGLN